MRRSMKRVVTFVFAVFVIVAASSSCVPESETAHDAIAKLKRRAASDLDCSSSEVRTNTIDDRTRVAEGCGRRATYVETCEACVHGVGSMRSVDRCNCTWVMDSARR